MRNLLVILVSLVSLAQIVKAEKKALVIAIGDYPESSNWAKISSQKDVPLITSALHHHGFKAENILIITDTLATKQGIIEAFKKITRDANEGDIYFIHYSGHGQQLWDKNGDELDGRDESIVPVDAPAKYIKGVYEGEKHLSDDELELLVADLRAKLGPNGSLTLVFDACHSGTATRGSGSGMAPGRGTTEFMGPPGLTHEPAKEGNTFNFTPATRGNAVELAPMVLFSGAGAAQLNYETQDEQGNFVGSLSYALSKTLMRCRAEASYKEIFDQVKAEMSVLAPKQSPQIEGDIQSSIFGGTGSDPVTYYRVSQVLDEKTCILPAGHLMGLFDASKVALYKAGTLKTENEMPLATGVVHNATLGNCDIIWDGPVTQEDQRNGNVFVLERGVGGRSIKVKISILERNEKLASEIRNEVRQYPQIVEVEDEAPDLLIGEFSFGRTAVINLETNNEQVLYSETYTGDDVVLARNLAAKIVAYGQAKFIKDLDARDASIDLQFEIIPITSVEEKEDGTGRYKRTTLVELSRGTAEEFTINNVLTLKEGTHFKIKITNRGKDLAYFCLLDIQPDNEINVLIPGKGLPPEEFKIKPGETIELPNIYTLYPPYGTEMFKLIATREPIDLRTIVASRGQEENRATQQPLGRLIQSTYKEKTRGGAETNTPVTIPVLGANTYSLIFQITKK